MSNLVFFMLDGNRLSGTIHSSFGRMSAAKQFWFGQNRKFIQRFLSGFLAFFVCVMRLRYYQTRFRRRESYVAISYWLTGFSGTIPTELGRMSSMKNFGLDDNRLTGEQTKDIDHFLCVILVCFLYMCVLAIYCVDQELFRLS